MSLAHSPGVVTNGLQFYYDMSNTQKSFKGQPTTNWFGIPTPDSSGNVTFPVQGTGTFQRIYAGTYGGYTIQPTDIVYKYVLGLAPTGCHYHGNTISVTTGQTPTWSFDYYIDGSTTGYPVTNYLANMESSVGVGTSVTDPTPGTIGVWKSATVTSAAATSNGTFNAYLYPGACGTQMATGGFILYKNPQVEFNSFATPFTTSTRSTSQAVVDITGKNTVTAINITYNSSNAFTFNGTTGYLQSGTTSIDWSLGGTVDMWINSSSASTTQGVMSFQAGNAYVDFYMTGSKMRWEVIGNLALGGYVQFYSNTTLASNTWYHIVGTFTTAGVANLYINGVLDATQTATNVPTSAYTATINIGTYAGLFVGQLPSTKIYNRTLSAAEVLQNFNAHRGRYGL